MRKTLGLTDRLQHSLLKARAKGSVSAKLLPTLSSSSALSFSPSFSLLANSRHNRHFQDGPGASVHIRGDGAVTGDRHVGVAEHNDSAQKHEPRIAARKPFRTELKKVYDIVLKI